MTRPILGLSYFGNRYPEHAERDLQAIKATGSSIVDHVMSEEDLRWYRGSLKKHIEMSHELGLEAWLCPWALGGVFGGEAASYAVMEHPDACQRDSRQRALPYLCFNQKPFRDLLISWLDAAVDCGADVVTWDEPHIGVPGAPIPGGDWACRCSTCQEIYRAEIGEPMPSDWNSDLASFNRSIVSRTVTWLVDEANNRGLKSAVIVFPVEDDADRGWQELASLPSVAYFGASPYWILQGVQTAEMEGYLRQWCQRIVAATRQSEAQSLAWLQAFSVPAGRELENARGVEIMVSEGIEVIAAWSYRACEAMSALAPDDPEKVWDTILRSFDQVTRK